MIIGVDAAVLAVEDDRLKAGVYNLVLNLLQHLTKIDKSNNYRFYSFSPIPQKVLAKFGPNVRNIVLKPKIGWLTLRLSLELFINKADVFLGLGQALPFFHPKRSIVYVYDLAFELYPQYYSDSYKRLARQTRFVGKKSVKIVAISNSTKKDLVKLYNVDPGKIEVIYPGINSYIHGVFLAPAKPYFLFVGSYKLVKNIPNIIKAFKLFLKETKKPYQLILAGSDYWMDINIVETIKELKLEKFVKLVGFVNDEELKKLYSGATAFVSPSYYEGFGLPILEAMAAGIPVITSNRGSIPEVVGDAALIVDPDDINKLKDAMILIDSDKKLKAQLIDKGLRQTQKFSWEKAAGELLNLLH